MRKLALGTAIAFTLCILCGCSASSKAEKGNYIISKEDQRILVANQISLKAAKSKTFTEFRKNNVEMINYIIEDPQLFDELSVGEQVIVTPKSNDKGEYMVMYSDPPQIVAGQIKRLNKLILTKESKAANRTIAWNAMEESEKKLVIKDWNKAEVSIITYKDQWIETTNKEEALKELKNHELITVAFNTKLDGVLGPMVSVINPETNKVVGYFVRF